MTERKRRPRTDGEGDSRPQLLTRLRRIEGQIRGLQRMVADETYCIDVLTQVAAVTKALQSVGLELLDDHLRHCLAGAAASGDARHTEQLVDEASAAISRMLKV